MKIYPSILFFLIFILIPKMGFAKDDFKPEWAVGISGGINFSSVSFSPKVEQNKLGGFTGGFTARWRTEKNLGLQAELNYKQQGWKEKFEDSNYKYERKLNYLEIPIYTHIYWGSKRVNFFINLGPQIGFNLSESSSATLAANDSTFQHEQSINKKFEWGLSGGPGVEFRTPIGLFILEGRYFYSFGDIYNTKRSDNFSKASSQVITAKISYLICL